MTATCHYRASPSKLTAHTDRVHKYFIPGRIVKYANRLSQLVHTDIDVLIQIRWSLVLVFWRIRIMPMTISFAYDAMLVMNDEFGMFPPA